ncbi:unnamed protein product [Lymnaea stagnalis]|uniref:Pentatricopeptide repeat-containing protein 2, mitochondrial n=1 Tax=Lymnaea stagnalis TaxID=6523 RepID=A0AAV2IPK7_LYMST
MATPLKNVFFQTLLNNRSRLNIISVYRTLLSEADTKIDRYWRQRIFKADELGTSGKSTLLQKLSNVKSPLDAKLCAYEIIDLIHVADTKQEVILLENLLCLLSESGITDIENFNFGASIIRLYHYLGLPEEAYALFKSHKCKEFLMDNTCHKVLMDLLYNHKQYQKVLDVFASLQKFNIDCITLALGAHYHINTEESFEAAQKLIKDYLKNYSLSRRAIMFYCMLAIQQNHPKEALQALNNCQPNNVTFNMKLISLAKLGQSSELMKSLVKVKSETENISRPLDVRLFSDTMKEISESLNESLSPRDFASARFLIEDLGERGVLSRQVITIFLDRTIPGNVGNRKQGGKQKVVRDSQRDTHPRLS